MEASESCRLSLLSGIEEALHISLSNLSLDVPVLFLAALHSLPSSISGLCVSLELPYLENFLS
jgi:hypothetical protein